MSHFLPPTPSRIRRSRHFWKELRCGCAHAPYTSKTGVVINKGHRNSCVSNLSIISAPWTPATKIISENSNSKVKQSHPHENPEKTGPNGRENISTNFGPGEFFSDFIHTTPQASVAELDVVTSVKEKATTAYDVDGKADAADGAPQTAGPSFWSFEFYKQLFDVNTQQITDRIVNSMVPRSGQNFLETFIKPKADLYGRKFETEKFNGKF